MRASTRWTLIALIAAVVAGTGGFLIGTARHGVSRAGVSEPVSTDMATTSATPSATPSPSVTASATSGTSTGQSTPTATSRSKRSKQSSPPPTPVSAPTGTANTSPVSCPAPTVTVTDAATLVKALTVARPGAVIHLADGTYSGQFIATVSGTADAPISLCGGAGAVIDGGSIKAGYAFHLQGAKYWHLVGFTVHGAQKGIVVDGGTGTVVQALTVSAVGDEAIHLRSATTFSVVRDNVVFGTGMHNKKYGEGIYIGSATSNWCQYSACAPDASNNNAIVGNTIRGTTSESIDIKEGTQNGLVEGNTFDGTGGLTAADSWVDVKGNGWTIRDNTGKNSPVDGFQVHSVVNGWGMNNSFESNVADVNGSGFGIHLAPVQNNTVYCNNKVAGAAGGLTNTSCV